VIEKHTSLKKFVYFFLTKYKIKQRVTLRNSKFENKNTPSTMGRPRDSSGEESSSSSSGNDSSGESADELKRKRSSMKDTSSSNKKKHKKESKDKKGKDHKGKDSKKQRHSSLSKEKKKKHKKDKKERSKRVSVSEDPAIDTSALTVTKSDEIAGGAKPVSNPMAEAAFSETQKWKKQVLEAAARAEAKLASGDLQRQKKEMVSRHNNFGGDSVDWFAKKKLNKAEAAQRKMVQVGRQLLEKEQQEKARMKDFLQALGVKVEDLPEEKQRRAEEEEAARLAAAERVRKEERARKQRLKGPAFPPPC